MGLYDTIRVGEREGQVKLWDCELSTFSIGDEVPVFQPGPYSIAMRGGGFVNIRDNRIENWTDEPTHLDIVNRNGEPFDPTSIQDRFESQPEILLDRLKELCLHTRLERDAVVKVTYEWRHGQESFIIEDEKTGAKYDYWGVNHPIGTCEGEGICKWCGRVL